jgi:hypothetical protein
MSCEDYKEAWKEAGRDYNAAIKAYGDLKYEFALTGLAAAGSCTATVALAVSPEPISKLALGSSITGCVASAGSAIYSYVKLSSAYNQILSSQSAMIDASKAWFKCLDDHKQRRPNQ